MKLSSFPKLGGHKQTLGLLVDGLSEGYQCSVVAGAHEAAQMLGAHPRRSLVVAPLFFGAEPLGTMILELDIRWSGGHEALADVLSAALHAARMLEVREHKIEAR